MHARVESARGTLCGYVYLVYNAVYHASGEEMDSGAHAGSRILCLDGGGIRGLIQIEVLSQVSCVRTCT